MITIGQTSWSNWFSYGEGNELDFRDSTLAQVSGTNGAGKTSLVLILQEILYGKNHKGIQKGKLKNRYIDNAALFGETTLYIDDDVYVVTMIRKTTLSLKLTKNGVDISSHTATETYKTIQSILGSNLDFKTFSQLIYQSSKNSLEFLTATDTNRKKFLIALFNLNKYLDIHEKFKKVEVDIAQSATELRGKVNTISNWIKKHSEEDLSTKSTLDIPSVNPYDIEVLASLKSKVNDIKGINKGINNNNQYIELLESIDVTPYQKPNIADKAEVNLTISKLNDEISGKSAILKLERGKHTKYSSLNFKVCPTCYQDIDSEKISNIINEAEVAMSVLTEEINSLSIEAVQYKDTLRKIQEADNKMSRYLQNVEEHARLSMLIDTSLPTETLNEADLLSKISEINTDIADIQQKILKISKFNSEVDQHNSRITVIQDQLADYHNQLSNCTKQADDLNVLLAKVGLIKKAFGTNGLLSYKLEYVVKDLEDSINKYLVELSDGKFQLSFALKGEKLDIEIIDDAKSVSIEELSEGELARINAATLLAIRHLMSAISSTKINVLFLDEVLGVLDEVGKERLIEILYNEKDLNTLLVSHEYSHPLIPKINVIKENKISRIEHG